MSYIGNNFPTSQTFTAPIFYANPSAILASITLNVGFNYMSVGPLTLSGNNVVTLPNGATWKIV